VSIVYLGLGANLGNRQEALRHALQLLQDSGRVTVCAVSSLYETAPMYVMDQPHFLNAVAQVETVLTLLKGVEDDLGRVARERYGPREVDLDILLYDELVLVTPQLTIPHQRMAERAFVLLPLAELAPHLVVAGTQSTVQELLGRLTFSEQVRLYRGVDWYAVAPAQ
jgi:2-amino-4-hydroxy-6-hydroxymethyldihydropteridine diphosphokinase